MKIITISRLLIASCAVAFSISLQAAVVETIVIKGSDTLGAKMVPQLAEAFKANMKEQGIEVAFEIAAEGSSTGVASVIDKTAQIGMSSRDLKEKEIAKAMAKGVDMKVTTVAKDAIAIVVNEVNPLDEIKLEEVEMIFSGDVVNWSAFSMQNGEISTYTRNTSSGTYATFQRMALSSKDYGIETQKMAGNEQIVSEVAGNSNAIGYVGLAYIDTAGIKVLPVEGASPKSQDYPLSRPLYFFTDGNKPLSPMAQKFIDFTLSPVGQEIVERVDFVPVNPNKSEIRVSKTEN